MKFESASLQIALSLLSLTGCDLADQRSSTAKQPSVVEQPSVAIQSNTKQEAMAAIHAAGGTLYQERFLQLDNTPITVAGLEQLKGLTYLNSIDLSTTQITDMGFEELRAALPDCEVRWR